MIDKSAETEADKRPQVPVGRTYSTKLPLNRNNRAHGLSDAAYDKFVGFIRRSEEKK